MNVRMHTCVCAYVFTLFNIEYWTQLCLVRSFVRSFFIRLFACVHSPVFVFVYKQIVCHFEKTQIHKIHTHTHTHKMLLFSLFTQIVLRLYCCAVVMVKHKRKAGQAGLLKWDTNTPLSDY